MALNINGTTGISGVDGSVSAPAVTGTDSNTGITFPSADTIKFSTGGVERMAITNSGVTGVGGKILQVVSTTETGASTATMSTNGEVTLMSRTYTPTVSSSNALILVSLHLDMDGSYGGMFINLLRDSTAFSRGDAAGNRRQVTIAPDISSTTFGGNLLGFSILDTGISGTSQVTYKVNLLDQSGGGGIYYMNTGRDNTNNNYILRAVSTLTVMEVGA